MKNKASLTTRAIPFLYLAFIILVYIVHSGAFFFQQYDHLHRMYYVSWIVLYAFALPLPWGIRRGVDEWRHTHQFGYDCIGAAAECMFVIICIISAREAFQALTWLS